MKILSKLDKKVQNLYDTYRKRQIRKYEKELLQLLTKQKELMRKLTPINKRIEAIQAEIKRLETAF